MLPHDPPESGLTDEAIAMKSDTKTANANRELEHLQCHKRRVYLLALTGGALIFMLSWDISAADDVFIRILYPVFAVVLLVLSGVMWRQVLSLEKMEIIMLTAVGLMVMARLVWHFYCAGPVDQQLLPLAGGHYWAIAILIVGGFVALDYKQGLTMGSIVLAASMLIAVSGIIWQMKENGLDISHGSVVYLIRVHVFMGVLLGMVSVVTTMRAKFRDALTRADTLDRWANTDMLTGLANRRAMDVFLTQQIEEAERYGRQLSVIIADIDDFKDINDQSGHVAGDEAIRSIAGVFTKTLRKSDFVARWGGDEFIVVAPEASAEHSGRVVERCRGEMSRYSVYGHNLTMTFGIAEYRSGETVDNLLAKADAMLYKGKQLGKNRVMIEP